MTKFKMLLATIAFAIAACSPAPAQVPQRAPDPLDVWQGQLAVCANVELTACDIYVSRDLYPTRDACLRQMDRYAAEIREQASGVEVRFRCVALPAA